MKNGFESGSRKLIPATLIYLMSGQEVLMLHRTGKENDFHGGKWNGVGGKLELNESAIECAVRETLEETGIHLEKSQLNILGVLHFPLFKPQKNEDWLCYVVTGQVNDSQRSQLISKGAEGELSWIQRDELLKLNLWEGDKLFLPHVLNNQKFNGTIWYAEQKVVRHEILA